MSGNLKRVYTGLAGLTIHENPVKELAKQYDKVLRALEKLPKESKYRTMTEKLIKDRLAVVQSTTDRDVVEAKLGGGVCEEFIEQAKEELELTEVIKKHQTWEPLTEKPPENQWKWPL